MNNHPVRVSDVEPSVLKSCRKRIEARLESLESQNRQIKEMLEQVLSLKRKTKKVVLPPHLTMFLEDKCRVSQDFSCRPPRLWQQYDQWCAEKNVACLGRNGFYHWIEKHCGARRFRPTGITTDHFKGIALKTDKSGE